MGQFINAQAASADAAMQATQARTQGAADRKAAYARAYGMESESAAAAHIAAQQMETIRQNQRAAISDARVANATSGFSASSGSKLSTEKTTAQIFEEALANASKSYVIQDQNARSQANILRKEGDDTLKMSEIMGTYYSKVSRINSNAATGYLLGGALSTIGDIAYTYNIGSTRC